MKTTYLTLFTGRTDITTLFCLNTVKIAHLEWKGKLQSPAFKDRFQSRLSKSEGVKTEVVKTSNTKLTTQVIL